MPIRFSLTGTGILKFLFRFLITGTGKFNLPSGSGLPETEFRFRSGFRPDIPVPVVPYTKVLKNVGARSVPVETYNNFVLEPEGLAEDKTAEEVLANTTIANNEENSCQR
jgi:hypothetical protein